MDKNVRQVRINELHIIYELEKSAFTPMNYPLFVLRQFYDLLPELFLVAVDKTDSILGYTLGGINLDNNQAWILSLAINQNYQGQGIGYSLSQKLIEKIHNKGMKNIFLTVHPENNSAIMLYKKLGFQGHEKTMDYYGDGKPRLVMVLQFDKNAK